MRLSKQLLLIDDDESIREMISFVFDHQDYQIKAVADAKNINKLLEEFEPDLVMVGTKNAGEICQDLKLLSTIEQVTLILLSSAVIHEDVPDCGQDLLIAKPFDIFYLKRMVEILIHRGIEASNQPS